MECETQSHLASNGPLNLLIVMHVEVETDGRWIAEIPSFPGAMAYGITRNEAVAKVKALVFRIRADKIECGGKALRISTP